MGRIQNAILQAGSAHTQGVNTPVVDLTFGGQMGFSPEYAEWVSNQAYIRRNLIPILIEAPKAYQYLPNPEVWVRTLRSLIELHPMSIEGLNATLEASYTTTPFGGSGQEQHDLSNVKESPSAPVFNYIEKYGRAISRFWRAHLTYLGMDPNSKVANIATLASARGLTDLLPDQTTFTVLFIEPDPLMKKVTQSWLVTNMSPRGTGDIIGSMDKTQDGQTTNLSIQMTGLHQYNAGVDAFAQRVLDGLSIIGANPNLRQAFVQDIAADVKAAQKGYAAGVQSLATNQIRV